MQQISLSFILLLLVQVILLDSVFAITKCQDAEGNWHYGDYATDVCANSKLTKLNDKGVKVAEVAAPKTEQELQEEQANKERNQAEKLAIEQAEAEKSRILSIYETESDIDRVRDNQLSSIQGNIDVHKAYIISKEKSIERLTAKQNNATHPKLKEKLQVQIDEAKSELEKSQQAVKEFEVQKIEIAEKFEKEKQMYRELKEQ